MNCLIITFSNHEIYNYFKLVVDNFYLTHSPVQLGPGILKQDASSTENGRTPGVWEFELDRSLVRAPGARCDAGLIHRLLTVKREFGSLRA